MPEKKIKSVSEMTERERYEMLCRGEITMPLSEQKELKCRYVDRGIPFLKIAPLKEEEAYLDPRIVIYHDVIYDEEIETIKRMAQPRVRRPASFPDPRPSCLAGNRVMGGCGRTSPRGLLCIRFVRPTCADKDALLP